MADAICRPFLQDVNAFTRFSAMRDDEAAAWALQTLDQSRSDALRAGIAADEDEQCVLQWLARHAGGERLGAIAQALSQHDELTGQIDARKLRLTVGAMELPESTRRAFEDRSGLGPLPAQGMLNVLWPVMSKVSRGGLDPHTGQRINDIDAARRQDAGATGRRRPAAIQLIELAHEQHKAWPWQPPWLDHAPVYEAHGDDWSFDLGPTQVQTLEAGAYGWLMFLPDAAGIASLEGAAMSGISWGSFVARPEGLGTLKLELASGAQITSYTIGKLAASSPVPDAGTMVCAETSALQLKGSYETPSIDLAGLIEMRGLVYGQIGLGWIAAKGRGMTWRPDGLTPYFQTGGSAGPWGYRVVGFIDIEWTGLLNLPKRMNAAMKELVDVVSGSSIVR